MEAVATASTCVVGKKGELLVVAAENLNLALHPGMNGAHVAERGSDLA